MTNPRDTLSADNRGLEAAADEYAKTHYRGGRELYGNIIQDFIAGARHMEAGLIAKIEAALAAYRASAKEEKNG